MTGKWRQGLTLIELLVVVTILAIVSLSLVPTAELITVRLLETQMQENLKAIRRAIRTWREDCEAAVEKEVHDYLTHSYGPPRRPEKTREVVLAIPDHLFYPTDIGMLTRAGVFSVTYLLPDNFESPTTWTSHTALFNHRAYLSAIPVNPFVQGPVWVQYYANNPASATLWEGGIIKGSPGIGVFDVGVPTSSADMRGFVQALDGTYYRDW
ncbi:MAG: hypothetical protein OZSIB_2479 [Candidatus Ozemobacter sibiricus]|jgi:prepilin-type N-terminal cleavage/methylation domain-containing protein|uniref:Prepilin-type N-terminal cleavage/methylation domain-containing protein n=1 Tax=Candidatus Ozemobacter sibiricus TaxID=2268124 RepID=A0A367ZUQ7_9BACT|nr:MAG: hypothetical protein OZSIB_2479 [Candidatus Ozemobacter sibiricus]